MKQLSIWGDCPEPRAKEKQKSTIWKLYIDGASRMNPGKGGAGVYVLHNEKLVYKEGFYLGIKTNNQAEYIALLLGIFFAKNLLFPHDVLYVFSDSELLIKHMRGEYKVRNDALKKLHALAHLLLSGIQHSFCHILREYNTEADALANKGIDDGTPPPQDFIALLNEHGISF